MPDELNGTTDIEPVTKQVVIPECLRGKIGYINLYTTSSDVKYHVTWKTTYYIVEIYDIRRGVYCWTSYISQTDNCFSEVAYQKDATRFPTLESAVEALEAAIKALGLEPLVIDHSSATT